MAVPNLRPLFNLSLSAGPRSDIGQGPKGRRIYVTLDGGQFEGDRLRGQVLPGGADALLVDANGSRCLDVRLVLRTNSGAFVYMTYTGVLVSRDDAGVVATGPTQSEASNSSLRFSATFETGAPELAWLNRILAIGIGEMTSAGPSYEVYELL